MNEFDFEKQLKQDLRRVEAPEGFADRVMHRVAQRPRGQLMMMPRRTSRTTASIAIAAMLLVGIVLGGWQWRQRELRERQQAELARQQFEVAMQVTGRTLMQVQERIGHVGEMRTGTKREVE